MTWYCSIMGHGEDEGIIPRFSDELFQKIESLKENSDDVVRVVLFSNKFQFLKIFLVFKCLQLFLNLVFNGLIVAVPMPILVFLIATFQSVGSIAMPFSLEVLKGQIEKRNCTKNCFWVESSRISVKLGKAIVLTII